MEAFNTGRFDLVATDDRRLIRRMTALGIQCVVPGILLYHLSGRGKINTEQALEFLGRLRPSISSDEYQVVAFSWERTDHVCPWHSHRSGHRRRRQVRCQTGEVRTGSVAAQADPVGGAADKTAIQLAKVQPCQLPKTDT